MKPPDFRNFFKTPISCDLHLETPGKSRSLPTELNSLYDLLRQFSSSVYFGTILFCFLQNLKVLKRNRFPLLTFFFCSFFFLFNKKKYFLESGSKWHVESINTTELARKKWGQTRGILLVIIGRRLGDRETAYISAEKLWVFGWHYGDFGDGHSWNWIFFH